MRFIKLLRIHQWLKNLLIFIPLLSVGSFNTEEYKKVFLCFLFFSIFVSASYIVNDLVDVKSDSLHPTKKNRPIAKGDISKNIAILLASSLFLVSSVYFILYQSNIVKFVLLYLFFTVAYSLKLKYVKYLDLIAISFLFILRLLIGGEVSDIKISIYLILMVLILSLSIVTSKKISILNNREIQDTKIKKHLLRAYSPKFLDNLFKSSLITSLLIYLLWVINVKGGTQTYLFYLLSFLTLLLCLTRFLTLTKEEETEEIINKLFLDSRLRNLVLIFSMFVLYSLYYE
tara:strand:+ start:1662 stop:2522 length:861 start_codon:yes stop_codon:yes gene_type:complete